MIEQNPKRVRYSVFTQKELCHPFRIINYNYQLKFYTSYLTPHTSHLIFHIT